MAENKIASKRNWKRLWNIAGLTALVAFGIAIGAFWGRAPVRPTLMTDDQCDSLSRQIVSSFSSVSADRLHEMNAFYARNCAGRKAKVAAPAPESQPQPLPGKACEAIEVLLEKQLEYTPEDTQNIGGRITRAQIFANMAIYGCSENFETYKASALREMEIARGLAGDNFYGNYDIYGVISMYKNLQMMPEAQSIFEQAKKQGNLSTGVIDGIQKMLSE